MTSESQSANHLYGDVDPLGYERFLTAEERTDLAKMREVLTQVKPMLDDAWDTASCPDPLREALASDAFSLPDDDAPRALFHGFRTFELARTDVSLAVIFGAQMTLFRNSVLLGGSEEQAATLEPEIRRWRTRGVLALTEPEHGSDVARGMTTTARCEGDGWYITGEKRWIGGAEYADVIVVVAKDDQDGAVKMFLVDRHAPGVGVREIRHKTALRIVNNGHISLDEVYVPESQRLQGVNSFRDVNRILRSMRADASWIACGAQAGAFRAAAEYAAERLQFGRPIASFQLVQDKLATMLGNLTASLGMAVRLSQLQDDGGFTDSDAALVKASTARNARQTVALGREIVGGNGITLGTDVSRFFADTEAVYTFEGTNEINQLVVGRAITGISAFV